MQLRLIFHKTVNKNKLIVKFQSHRLSSFSAIKKTVTKVKGGDGVSSFCSHHNILSVNVNFQYKLNSHKSLLIVTANLFSSIILLIVSHLQFHFFSLILVYEFNEHN